MHTLGADKARLDHPIRGFTTLTWRVRKSTSDRNHLQMGIMYGNKFVVGPKWLAGMLNETINQSLDCDKELTPMACCSIDTTRFVRYAWPQLSSLPLSVTLPCVCVHVQSRWIETWGALIKLLSGWVLYINLLSSLPGQSKQKLLMTCSKLLFTQMPWLLWPRNIDMMLLTLIWTLLALPNPTLRVRIRMTTTWSAQPLPKRLYYSQRLVMSIRIRRRECGMTSPFAEVDHCTISMQLLLFIGPVKTTSQKGGHKYQSVYIYIPKTFSLS